MAAKDDTATRSASATSTDPEPTEWDLALANFREAWALWPPLGADYTDEQSDAVGAIAFPALERLMATPRLTSLRWSRSSKP